jgi:predicted amidophosphoribosyltransferase
MADILKFERKSKPSTDKEYFAYAEHTGLCPKCGKKLKVIYTCQRCAMTTIICYCGLHIERSIP